MGRDAVIEWRIEQESSCGNYEYEVITENGQTETRTHYTGTQKDIERHRENKEALLRERSNRHRLEMEKRWMN